METTNLLDLPDHIIVENILALLVPSSLFEDGPNVKDLRDILSFASTCTRIHALASHPSVWRRVNARVFLPTFVDLSQRGVVPSLPLGAVHCGALRFGFAPFDDTIAYFVELLRDLTDTQAVGLEICRDTVRGRIVRALSSLPRLTSFKINVKTGNAASAFAGVKLASSQSLESLVLVGTNTGISEYLSFNTFPSLTTLIVCGAPQEVFSDDVAPAIARSCPVIVDVEVRGDVTGRVIASLAGGCPSLRKISVFPCRGVNLTADGVAPHASFPNVRELVIYSHGRVTGGFLSLFPNLVRLEMKDFPKETDEDMRAIGGMTNLEHLALNAFMSGNLLPLTRGRRSLRSLSLSFFRDLGDFLSSPWCSHLVDLSLSSCRLPSSEFDRFTAVHGATLSSTLRHLAVWQPYYTDGFALGRFVAALLSLDSLVFVSTEKDFDVNGFVRGMGHGRSRVSSLCLLAHKGSEPVDVVPMHNMISYATAIEMEGNFDQCAIDAVAESCPYLCKFTVHTPRAVSRPKYLVSTCTFEVKVRELFYK